MATAFLDSSAIAKFYHPEPGSDRVEALVMGGRLRGEAVYVSQLAIVEVRSVFVKKVRTGMISAEDSTALRDRFLADLRTPLMKVARINSFHYEEAAQLIQRYGDRRNLRTLHAIQLAVVLDLRQQGLVDTFVCADKALCGIAEHAGLRILNPEYP